MNQYFHSKSLNRNFAVRLNGIAFASLINNDYERIPATAKLRFLAFNSLLPTYLPHLVYDKTTGYKKLTFQRL